MAGRRISCSKSGLQLRLYSDFPFPWRTDGGPQDAFDREALEKLRRSPNSPHFDFTEFDGRPCVRYATARRMQTSCLGCHNGHLEIDDDESERSAQDGLMRRAMEQIRPNFQPQIWSAFWRRWKASVSQTGSDRRVLIGEALSAFGICVDATSETD